MKDFYQKIRLGNSKVKNSFADLHNLYNSIPATKGCLENIKSGECCGGWCCKIQTPQLLYCEFLLIWNYISRNKTDDEICELFRRCMLNATKNVISKGCVFFDGKEKLCKIHKVRPFNCRVYGITPEEEFNDRYERLKEECKNIPGVKIEKQCTLVSTEDNSEVTIDDANKWWESLNEIEKSIGVKEEFITDALGGSYRTPHDHILLYNMPNNILSGISGIRLYDSYVDKANAIDNIIQKMKEFFDGQKRDKSKNP